jgi:hypothetical protein
MFGFKTLKTVKELHTKVKTQTDKDSLSHVIYSIKCSCSKFYVGLTTQKFRTRIKQHMNGVEKMKSLLNAPIRNNNAINALASTSALVLHYKETQHQFDFEDASILDHTSNYGRLKFNEMLYINDLNTINFRKDIEGLNNIYGGILHILKTKF